MSSTAPDVANQEASPGPSQDVDLERFEMLVYSRQYEEAGRDLITVLTALSRRRWIRDVPYSEEAVPKVFTRLAAAIGALLVDPNFHLSERGFDLLAAQHESLATVFELSAFGNSDHILRLFGTPDPAQAGKLHYSSPQTMVKLLLAYSFESNLDIDFESAFREAPRLALPSFLAMLAHNIVCSPLAHLRREKLLTLGHLFESVNLNDHMLAPISDAFMYCSYATGDNKHGIKRSFNRLLRRFIESRIKLPTFGAKRAQRAKPRITIPIEWFTSIHAMYRCFAPSIERLREDFHLTVVGRESELDATAKAIFHDVVEFPVGNIALDTLAARVTATDPDIVFYPSVGMTPWWTALASIRLAPIQVAATGHSATTMSESMDYMVVEDWYPGHPSTYSETVVVRRGGFPMAMRHDAKVQAPEIRDRPELLRIAVPGMAAKITAPFLEMCRAIANGSRRPVEFRFFPAMDGARYFRVQRQIRRWIPGALVYPVTHYNDYMRNLGACDVKLGTYPFGGINSGVDAILLAIPMVTLEGREHHSQADAGILRAIGMPDWMIAHSADEYVAAALRLIHNDGERIALAKHLLDPKVKAALFDAPGSEAADDYPKIFNWIYANHETIQASGKRFWTVPERLSGKF